MNPRDTKSEFQKLRNARNFGKGAREQLQDQAKEEVKERTYNLSDDDDFIVEEKTNKALKRPRANERYIVEDDEKYTPVRPNKNQTFAMIQPKVESNSASNIDKKSLFQGENLMDDMLDQIMDEDVEDNEEEQRRFRNMM